MFFIRSPLPYHTNNRIIIAFSRYISLHYHVLSLILCYLKSEKCGFFKEVQALFIIFLLLPSLFLHDTDGYVGVIVFTPFLMLLQLLHIEFVQPVTYDVLGTK